MKSLIYAAGLLLAVNVWVPSVQATASMDALNVTHIMGGSANPSQSRFQGGTHLFQIHVQGKALSELEIDFPKNLKIRKGIEIKNQWGEKISATVSINNEKATIVFPQAVPPETRLSVKMEGVTIQGIGSIWLHLVSGKMVGLNEKIPIGTVRIQTYGR